MDEKTVTQATRWTDGRTEKQIKRKRWTDGGRHRQINRQRDEIMDEQTGRYIERQMNKWMNR
jgi:hypothetical protein